MLYTFETSRYHQSFQNLTHALTVTSTYARDKKRDKKLGQLLVERGWITGEQLIRAIQSQRMVGGRLGTCLLEMDVLDEEHLLDALSDQLRVPAAGLDQLRVIDDGILNLVPAKVAERRRAVPFYADREEIKVATLEVHDLTLLDELRFCTNRRVVPHIANEVRIFEALEKHYGLELPSRLGYLLDRLNRARYLWDESAKILLGADSGEIVWSRPEDVFERRASDKETSRPRGVIQPATARSRRPSGAAAPGVERAPVAIVTAPARPVGRDASSVEPGAGLESVDHELGQVTDRHGVADVLLRFAGRDFSRVAMFEVRDDRVRGWRLGSTNADESLFTAYEASLTEPSAFATLGRGARHFLGPLPPMPAHRRLARAWGDELPAACLMVPIRVRDRLVAVLYGDRGPRELDDVDPETYRRLATKAAMAFELCILRRKLQSV